MNMAVEVHAPSQPVLVVGVLVALLALILLHAWGQHACCILVDDFGLRGGIAWHRGENLT